MFALNPLAKIFTIYVFICSGLIFPTDKNGLFED